MTRLSKSQLSILETLKAASGPMPANALAGGDADLKALAQTGFITRKAKSVRITEIGLAALEPVPKPVGKPEPKCIESQPKTKKARLIALLSAKGGVTVTVLAETLGWLPHTTRAALTGLKKDGMTITRLPPEDGSRASRYTLASADEAA